MSPMLPSTPMPRTYPPYSRHRARTRAAREAVRLRLAIGWTQEDMAHALGVSPRSIQRLESGHLPASKPLYRLLRHVTQAAGAPGR